MRHTATALILLMLLTTLFACDRPYTAEKLSGDWIGTSFTHLGRDLSVNPQDFRFEFTPEGRYVYAGTANYREEGNYRVESDRLYTTDELQSGALEKAVRLLHLTPDTLRMQMNDAGREQILTLARVAE